VEDDLAAELRAAGWDPVSVTETTAEASAERWISVIARNPPLDT
jgi:hypothetical protein